MALKDPFKALRPFSAGGKSGQIYSVPALEQAGLGKVSRLPVSIRLVLESVLRNCDGVAVTENDVKTLAAWNAAKPVDTEIPFVVARIVLQDFTGVPLLVDLAAMREAVAKLGKDSAVIEPLVPVDLVVDHSVQVDKAGTASSFLDNLRQEFGRNTERYEFLKWGMQAFKTFGVVPPAIGIVHQVNLEYLAKLVFQKDGVFYPDTLVGTDSHTTMINGIGVVGWGVGGIEAEAGMLGQPVYFQTPEVIGVNLTGRLREGVTATDLTLRLTEILRKAKVVGKFVEFYGEGTEALSLADRATIANMAPEYGATMGFFPVDDKSLDYLRQTGRDEAHIELVKEYYKAQGLFGIPKAGSIDYTQTIDLDIGTVVPCVSGPKRPQDRIDLPKIKESFNTLFTAPKDKNGFGKAASDRAASAPVGATGRSLQHGSVVIAAITSCTNTSNPSVMVAAGLVAKKAVEKGLKVNPNVKCSLAPGSRVVTDYLNEIQLSGYLDQLGFNLVGYGCTTCIGNSGPLDADIEGAIKQGDLVTASVLSGNRNFEARVHGAVRSNFLMSPPLVVAFALAGRVDIDLDSEPLGTGKDGQPQGRLALPGRSRRPRRPRPQARDVQVEVRRRLPRQRHRRMEGRPRRHRRSLQLEGIVHLHPGASVLQGLLDDASSGAFPREAAPAGHPRRLRHDRPHLPGRRLQGRDPGRQVPPRGRRVEEGLQLLRFAPRQRPHHDPRHLRQHPGEERDGRRQGRRLHQGPARGQDRGHLRRLPDLRAAWRRHDRLRRRRLRHGLVP
jgi:aconitate hydratase